MCAIAWCPSNSRGSGQKCPRQRSNLLILSIFVGRPTNDRRYESKDSRDIEKGSFSSTRLRWLEDLVEPGYLRQKLCFSGGEGFACVSHCSQSMSDGVTIGPSIPEDRYRCRRPLQRIISASSCTAGKSHRQWMRHTTQLVFIRGRILIALSHRQWGRPLALD